MKNNRLAVQRDIGPEGVLLNDIERQLQNCLDVEVKPTQKIEELRAQINKNNAEISLIRTEVDSSRSRIAEIKNSLTLVRNRIA